MQWGQRRARRLTTWLAFASIVLQAIVLATHLHPDSQRFDSYAAVAGRTNTLGRDLDERRHHPAPSKQGGDDCAICFALHLANASAPPDAPALPGAAPNDFAFASFGGSLGLPILPYLHFRTRAPPVVEVAKASV